MHWNTYIKYITHTEDNTHFKYIIYTKHTKCKYIKCIECIIYSKHKSIEYTKTHSLNTLNELNTLHALNIINTLHSVLSLCNAFSVFSLGVLVYWVCSCSMYLIHLSPECTKYNNCEYTEHIKCNKYIEHTYMTNIDTHTLITLCTLYTLGTLNANTVNTSNALYIYIYSKPTYIKYTKRHTLNTLNTHYMD